MINHASIPPILLIVSGGSSGSHLLARLVSQYKPYAVGPEPNLASRPDLFLPGEFKLALFNSLCRRDPYFEPIKLESGKLFWVVPPMVFTNNDTYCYPGQRGLLEILEQSYDWGQMICNIRNRLVKVGLVPPNSMIIDHSPSAAVSTFNALHYYPNIKVIHIVRDPRDSIVSMMRRREKANHFRGIGQVENLHITAMQWSLLNACALKAEGVPNYLRIRYEELVMDAETTMRKVVEHLKLTNEDERKSGALLIGDLVKNLNGRHSPLKNINPSSVGRYKDELTSDQLTDLENKKYCWKNININIDMKIMIEMFKWD